jgi:hypothetical protein
MARDYSPKERAKMTKARRDHALSRVEFREPSAPREPAAGATSFAVKKTDTDVRALIDAALAKREKAL